MIIKIIIGYGPGHTWFLLCVCVCVNVFKGLSMLITASLKQTFRHSFEHKNKHPPNLLPGVVNTEKESGSC